MKLTCLFLTTLAAAALAREVTIVLPPEKPVLKPGAGAELAQANCLICHSAEYIGTQPKMPRAFWAAAVKKMREKYAAPVPEETVEALVNYLVASYGKPDAK